MCACIEPSVSTAKPFDEKFLALQIDIVHIGDLDFPTTRGPQGRGNVEHLIVIEVEPRDCVIGFRSFRLFSDADHPTAAIELENTILCRIRDYIGEYRGAALARCRALQEFRKA